VSGSNPCREVRDGARVVVVGADAALFALLHEWLAHNGYRVLPEATGGGSGARADIVVVDAPFDDVAGTALLARVARDYPATPVLLLSSRLLAGVRHTGPVAQALGVATVLPKPVKRDTLVDAIGRLRAA
jgi:CheY-like chemotaxis protein